MTAVLEVTEPMPGVRQVVIDCPHGVTTVLAGGRRLPADDVAVRLAVARHVAEQGCTCTDFIDARASGAAAN